MQSRISWSKVLIVGTTFALLGTMVILTPGAEARGRWFGHHRHGRMLSDPQEAQEHVRSMTDLALRLVDATDDQRSRINAITDKAVIDLTALHKSHGDHRAAVHAALGAAQIDRAELERLRAGAIADAETASTILTNGIADIAEVLTPEQRRELLATAEKLHD